MLSLWKRSLQALLAAEVQQALEAGVPDDDDLVEQARAQCEALRALSAKEGPPRLDDLRRDLGALEAALARVRDSDGGQNSGDDSGGDGGGGGDGSGGGDDGGGDGDSDSEVGGGGAAGGGGRSSAGQSNALDQQQLTGMQDVMAAAGALQRSLDAALPFADENTTEVPRAQSALREALHLLAANMSKVKETAAVVSANADRLPGVEAELAATQDSVERAQALADQRAADNRELEAEKAALNNKLADAEAAAAAEAERLRDVVAAREADTQEEKQAHAATAAKLREVRSCCCCVVAVSSPCTLVPALTVHDAVRRADV